MDESNYSIPKSLRKTIEKTVDSLIDNHEVFQTNPFVTSIDSIVENIIKSHDMQNVMESLEKQSNVKLNSGEVISFDMDECETFRTGIQSPDKNLELLTSSHLIATVIDHKTWIHEAKVLRDHLLSKNNETFLSSYRKHIILITHPQTLNEGILNLIQTVKLYFLRASKQNVSNNFRISLRITVHKNILKIISLLLQSFKLTSRNYKQSVVENIITQMLELINLDANKRKIDRINVLNYISILDPTAVWFKDLSYNTFNRNIILNYMLKEPMLIDYFVGEIVMHKNLAKSLDLDQNIKQFVFNDRCDILQVILRAASFCHSLYVIGELICYNHSYKLPFVKLRLNNGPALDYSLICVFLDVTMSFQDITVQKLKRHVITDVLKKVLTSHGSLFNIPEARLSRLFEPLNLDRAKQNMHDTAINSLYLFEICYELSKQENAVSVLFNFNININPVEKYKFKYKRLNICQNMSGVTVSLNKIIKQYLSKENENTCIVDVLCNFVTAFLRYYINNVQKYKAVYSLPSDILNYLHKILTSEDHILYWYKCQNLQYCAKDLYKFLVEQKQYLDLLTHLEHFLFSTCTTLCKMKVFDDDQDIFFLFGNNYLASDSCKYWKMNHFHDFILNMVDNMYGCEAIFMRLPLIITPQLDKIWKLAESQDVMMSGSDRLVNEAIHSFLQMVITFTFSLKFIQVILKENIEECNSKTYPMNIHDLIEHSLRMTGPGNIVCYTGLLMIRLLITNLDIYLHLENKYSVQEKLIIAQSQLQVPRSDRSNTLQSPIPKTIQPFILDETSLLRQEIIEYLNNLSCFNNKIIPQLIKKNSGTTVRKQVHELQRFLKETKHNLHDNSWLIHCRRAHKQCLDEVIKEFVIIELIRQVKILNHTSISEFEWPNSEVELKDLQPEEKIAVATIVKYGVQNKIIQSGAQNEEALSLLIRQSRIFLKQSKEQYSGFDWFVGVMFLICGGNYEKTKNMLSIIADMPVGKFIWPTMSLHDNVSFCVTFESQLKMMLHEVEHLDIIFEGARISVNGLTKYMLNQCFLNILQWNEICHFIAISILYSTDYIVYYIITIFRFLKKTLMMASISKDLDVYNKMLHLEEYKIKQAFPLMESLAKQYKSFFNN